MHRNAILAALAPVLMLGACGRAQGPADETTLAPPANAAKGAAAASPSGAAASNGADSGRTAPSPPAPPPQAERGPEGARHLLRSFAQAIEAKAFADA